MLRARASSRLTRERQAAASCCTSAQLRKIDVSGPTHSRAQISGAGGFDTATIDTVLFTSLVRKLAISISVAW
ncbi:hypothetical protein B0E46_15695 [Rhodanobacter sp. B04]|nr:hypothetical protein B0E46_15695 [Rhodanobacter sp. B04]